MAAIMTILLNFNFFPSSLPLFFSFLVWYLDPTHLCLELTLGSVLRQHSISVWRGICDTKHRIEVSKPCSRQAPYHLYYLSGSCQSVLSHNYTKPPLTLDQLCYELRDNACYSSLQTLKGMPPQM